MSLPRTIITLNNGKTIEVFQSVASIASLLSNNGVATVSFIDVDLEKEVYINITNEDILEYEGLCNLED